MYFERKRERIHTYKKLYLGNIISIVNRSIVSKMATTTSTTSTANTPASYYINSTGSGGSGKNANDDASVIQEGQARTLSDITELQNIEFEYFEKLNKGITDNSLTQDEKESITKKINEISQMRVNMYKNMNGGYNLYRATVATTRDTMSEQNTAIQIVENELNEAKRRLASIEDEKHSKYRMIEIGNYYSQQYNDKTTMMKIVVGICVPILILSVIYNRGLLPRTIYVSLFVCIAVIGIILLGRHLIDFYMRDNMVYDEYSWQFYTPPSTGAVSSSTTDPWANGGDTNSCLNSQINDLYNSSSQKLMSMNV